MQENASSSHVLGRKLDSIPFSGYHIAIILVLGAVGFVEGYDLALGGSLLVLANVPLSLTDSDIRWLVVAPSIVVVLGGFAASAMSDRISRKTAMQIGVIISTGTTLLIPLPQTGNPNGFRLIALPGGLALGWCRCWCISAGRTATGGICAGAILRSRSTPSTG